MVFFVANNNQRLGSRSESLGCIVAQFSGFVVDVNLKHAVRGGRHYHYHYFSCFFVSITIVVLVIIVIIIANITQQVSIYHVIHC